MSPSYIQPDSPEAAEAPQCDYSLGKSLTVETSAPQSLMASAEKDEALINYVRQSQVSVPWCDEFERMISGMPYVSSRSSSMLSHKLEVRRLLLSFNDPSIPPDATYQSLEKRRMSLARQIFGKVGDGSTISMPLYCTWGCNTTIGEGTFLNRDIEVWDSAPVKIGARCAIGPGTRITTDTHGIEIQPRRNGHGFAKPVIIGDDCWIAAGVTILAGVTIGRGCTIGACAMVNRDIPECSVAVGIPAKVVKRVRDPDLDFPDC